MSVHTYHENKHFIPIASCIPVKGYLRGLIHDLQRRSYHYTPNELCDIMLECKGMTTNAIAKQSKILSLEILNEYNELLERIEAAVWVEKNEVDFFPELNTVFDSPYIISSVSIEIDESTASNINSIFAFLNEINCQNVNIIINFCTDLSFLKNIADIVQHSPIRFIELIIKYDSAFSSTDEIKDFIQTNRRFYSVTFFNSPMIEKIEIDQEGHVLLYDINDIDLDYKHSLVDQRNFVSDIQFYSESKNFNNYYNKKLFITSDLSVRLTPQSESLFLIDGARKREYLHSIVSDNNQVEMWTAKKDHCDVCKHCEFRYMCVDNRIPIKRNKGEWYFESECNYNPFIAKWSGEDGYKKLSECGVTSNHFEYQIDDSKLAAINADLWD